MSYLKMIQLVAKTVKIPSALLLAVCMQETGLVNTVNKHDGGSASIGICQVKKSSAEQFGYKGTAKGLMDPRTNIYYAALYLKHQIDRYDGNLCRATAAYNSGSYHESLVKPGFPKNLRYVRGVQRKIAVEYKDALSCKQEVAEE